MKSEENYSEEFEEVNETVEDLSRSKLKDSYKYEFDSYHESANAPHRRKDSAPQPAKASLSKFIEDKSAEILAKNERVLLVQNQNEVLRLKVQQLELALRQLQEESRARDHMQTLRVEDQAKYLDRRNSSTGWGFSNKGLKLPVKRKSAKRPEPPRKKSPPTKKKSPQLRRESAQRNPREKSIQGQDEMQVIHRLQERIKTLREANSEMQGRLQQNRVLMRELHRKSLDFEDVQQRYERLAQLFKAKEREVEELREDKRRIKIDLLDRESQIKRLKAEANVLSIGTRYSEEKEEELSKTKTRNRELEQEVVALSGRMAGLLSRSVAAGQSL